MKMNIVNDDKNAHHGLTNRKQYDKIIKEIITITDIDLIKVVNQPPYVSHEHPAFFFHFVIPRNLQKEKSYVNSFPPPHLGPLNIYNNKT